jgi:hypothetical protein
LARYWKTPRRQERVGKKSKRIGCGVKETIGDFSSIVVYKTETMLEEEEEEEGEGEEVEEEEEEEGTRNIKKSVTEIKSVFT